jgi:hypothetical protein
MIKPEDLTASSAEEYAKRYSPTAYSIIARNMINGYMLGPAAKSDQEVKYWSGPIVYTSAVTGIEEIDRQVQKRNSFLTEELHRAIKNSFVSRNFVKEVVERHMNAVIGRNPTWQTESNDELSKLLTAFWDNSGALGVIQDLCKKAISEAYYSDEDLGIVGRAVLRLRIPALFSEARPGGGKYTAFEVASKLRVEILEGVNAAVWEDPNTLQRIGVYTYSLNKVQHTELCYTLGDATVYKLFVGQELAQELTAELGGNLAFLHELKTPPLISSSLISNQIAFNTALTMMQRNTHLAGFVERVAIDITPNKIATGQVGPDGKPETQIVPPVLGSGTINYYQSSTDLVFDPNTRQYEGVSRGGSYQRFEPVSGAPLESALQRHEASIYYEAHQAHLMSAATAAVSGRSREISMDDFRVNLSQTQGALESFLRGLMSAVLQVSKYISGESFEIPNVVVTCRRDVSTRSPVERQLDQADLASGTMSLETYLYRIGIDDPEAEIESLQGQVAKDPEPGPTQDTPKN